MTFGLRFVVIVLAAFTVANLAACAFVPWLMRRTATLSGGTARAAALQRARLFPFAFSLVAAAWTALGFLLFEGRHDEAIGVMLPALAAGGALLIGAAVIRLVWIVLRARRARLAWWRDAEPLHWHGLDVPAFAVSSSFPVVAIVGIFRPRLLIARSVLMTCTPDQVRVIVEHERAHLRRHDNLVRMLFNVAPDVLSWLPMSARLAHAWHDAAEDAADDGAAAAGPTGRLELAEALLRVARLVAAGSRPVVLPASALYRGENIERRVRRLLAPPAEIAAVRDSRRTTVLTSAMLVAAGLLTLNLVHALVELAVTFLP